MRLAGHENVGGSGVGRLEFQMDDLAGNLLATHHHLLDTDEGFRAVRAERLKLQEQPDEVRESLAGMANKEVAPSANPEDAPRLLALAELYLEKQIDPLAKAIAGGVAEPQENPYARMSTMDILRKLRGYDPNDAESLNMSLKYMALEYIKRRRKPSTTFADRQ